MTFTAVSNGSMSRHLKTRASTPLNSQLRRSPSPAGCSADSDGGTSNDSSEQHQQRHRHLRQQQHRGRLDEFNNNEIAKRNSPEILLAAKHRGAAKRKYQDYLEPQEPEGQMQLRHKIFARTRNASPLRMTFADLYVCDHCGIQDFENIEAFVAHVEVAHPDSVARCDACDLSFKNHRDLCFHRLTVHVHHPLNHSDSSVTPYGANQNSIVGFKDLTFVDFTTGKFPAIARAVCEQALHRPATDHDISFQCSKCLRGFPCQSALDAHETECGLTAQLNNNNHQQSTNYRNNFFAGLDLQDKAALLEAKEGGKDLADIQSILSVTSGTPLLHNFARSDPGTPEHCGTKSRTGAESSGSSGTPCSSESHEEEAQDPYIEEIRKWKQKGEFPCRLCHQTYPNLRALKGHNRVHTSEDSGVPYPCNVCTYNGTDRATLMKHMKSHSGDRPYECSLCKFGFTTKANCERHVRKRHFKLTRDEIKEVMVYNPSEDPTNSAHYESSGSASSKEVRKSLVYPEIVKDTPKPPPSLLPFEKTMGLYGSKPTRILDPPHWPVKPQQLQQHLDEDQESRSSEDSASLVSDAKKEQAYQSGPIDLKKIPAVEETPPEDEEAPLDLSMDVLDLSKKSSGSNSSGAKDANAEHSAPLESASDDEYINARNQILLTQALLKSGQVPMPPMYANSPMMYGNFGAAFPGVGAAGLLQQYMFNPHLFSAQEFALKERFQKELVRGLQTSGGNLVDSPAAPGLASPPFNPIRSPIPRDPSPSVTKLPMPVVKMSVPRPKHDSPPEQSSVVANNGSVKMVIKNGVLMPRQKQRRYRTERPFMCGHCTAKFTLRSNMERHIKQQHPQHWSQRPRGGYSTRGRPPANPPTLLAGIQDSLQTGQQQPQQAVQVSEVDNQQQVISDQVKYAILAQKLKGPVKQEEVNESDEELIIDEKETAGSLLRGKLEDKTEDDPPIVKCETILTIKPERIETELTPDVVEEEPRTEAQIKSEPSQDLASVSEILDNTNAQKYRQFQSQYMSDEDAAHASTSDCNPSTDETSDCAPVNNNNNSTSNNNNNNNSSSHHKKKRRTKKSAYSMAPNRVICPYCDRPFPWNSSLRRHVLTHTGQKPFQCKFCNLPFTTKSNRDRHMLRKHKASANKLRQTRRTSSPELPEIASATNNFNMRNVPERPYKCNQCPSSTFSTLGNLKKHRSVKHSSGEDKYEGADSAHSSDNQHSPAAHDSTESHKHLHPNDQSGYESQSSTTSEVAEPPMAPVALTMETMTPTTPLAVSCNSNNNASSSGNEAGSRCSKKTSPRESPGPSDAAPFKCHLCDSGFAVRQDCQEHIKSNHKSSYDMLVAKGAMDMSQELIEENIPSVPQQPPQNSSDGEEKRGRFPDYSNRKVVCAFCMRRFWSAEDLRRHMRTHTGERPFFCDICNRRFTLKHSMLRHRKKHAYAGSSMYVGTSGDEDGQSSSAATSPNRTSVCASSAAATATSSASATATSSSSVPVQPPTATPRSSTQLPQLQQSAQISGGRASLPQTASVGDAAPSGLSMRYNPYERLVALRRPSPPPASSSNNNDEDDVNLISNLLGLSNSVVKEAMSAPSPDLAAQMIGAP